jgi:ankyrin repeat protein
MAKNLSGRALLEALALSPGDSRLDPEAMTSEEDILKWCSSLVRRRADGSGLELAHFTVKEYLESIKPESDPRFGKFKISKPESDLLIGSICLTYLTLDSFAEAPLPVGLFDGIYADLDESSNTHSANDEDSTNDEACDEDLQESDEELALEEMQRSEEDEEKHDSDGGESEKRETESPAARNDTPDMLFRPYLDRYPLLLFAAGSWYKHCRDNLWDPVVAALTHKLFHPRKSNQFLWWSYALMCDYQCDTWDQTFSDATTLHWAALLELEEVCAWLTQSGSDINRGSSLGTPLDCLLLGTTAIWRFDDLEDHYWDMYEPKEDDAASTINKKSIAHLLIGAGLKLNESPDSSTMWLPLQLALITDRGNSDLIALLLQAGAKVDLCALGIVERYVKKIDELDKDRRVPSGYLALFEKVTADEVQEDARLTFSTLSEKLSPHGLQRPQLWETLKLGSASAAVDVSQLNDWFFQAMEHGQIDDARTLMTLVRDRLPSADSERVLGLGLQIAAQKGHEHIVNDMLESGVDPKMVDSDGDSTLNRSLLDVHDVGVVIRIVEALLARGADLNLRNNKDELVFHLAAKSKKNGLFKAVVDVAGDPAIQIILDSSNPSVLQYAVEKGSDETVSYLLDIYTDIDENKHRSKAGYSLLAMAAGRETALALRQLLSRGLSIKVLDADGSSVLCNAVTMDKLETFNALMEAGATDNSSREDRRRAVHAAAESDDTVSLSMLEALLSAGEDPNATSNDGDTPLQLTLPRPNRAFTKMGVSKMKLLMEQSGINHNYRTLNGRTPLMFCLDSLAVIALNWEQTKKIQKDTLLDSINVLIDHSANLNLVDDNGATALHHIYLEKLTKVSFDVIKNLVTRGSILHHRNKAGVTPFEMLLCSSMKKLGEPNGEDPNEHLSVIEVLRFIIVHMPAHRLNDRLSN